MTLHDTFRKHHPNTVEELDAFLASLQAASPRPITNAPKRSCTKRSITKRKPRNEQLALARHQAPFLDPGGRHDRLGLRRLVARRDPSGGPPGRLAAAAALPPTKAKRFSRTPTMMVPRPKKSWPP